MQALGTCSNTVLGPDGISFSSVKKIAPSIFYSLLVIYQQSLAHGIYPTSWKCAHIVPLYKGKGARTSAISYRPISLCSCLGKLLEKIVKKQLERYLKNVRPLSSY